MLVLASASERRHQLLQQITIPHRCLAVDIDETPRPQEVCDDYVVRMAREKAQAARALCQPEAVILAADTSVCLDDQIFGKPSNRDAAKRCLQWLSGKTHRVLSAVALCQQEDSSIALSVSYVKLKALQDEEIDWWLAHDEFSDKAGAYAIQGASGAFVEHIEGSYSGVVGLPLYETTTLLRECKLWPPHTHHEEHA